jgi:hypothetical protein
LIFTLIDKIEEKTIGHPTFPVSDFSLTIIKSKGDIAVVALDIVYEEFIKPFCIKGAIATEVGTRAHNLHLQGVFKARYPTNREWILKLNKQIKRILPYNGTQYRVNVKPFGNKQNFNAMIGYVTKDHGQTHYQLRSHNVTAKVSYISFINCKI